MLPSPNGSHRIFTLFGITAYLHWTWLIGAVFFYQFSGLEPIVFISSYVGLFLIVLMHEFGHSLACRWVGGKAEHIVLFPLGGVAYVNPPPRPGAVLWSVAAGPLVNVVLIPIFMLAQVYWIGSQDTLTEPLSSFQQMIIWLSRINLVLLIFNILPIYPLDGGQIVQSILWFFIGYRKSLQITASIGMVAGIGMVVLGLFSGEFMLIILAVFIFFQALKGYGHAKLLAMNEKWEQNMQDMQQNMQDMFNRAPGGGTSGSGGFGTPGGRASGAKPQDDADIFDPKTHTKKRYMDED